MTLDSLLFVATAFSARGKEVEASDETTFSAGLGGPESVLAGWLWRIPGDDHQQFHTHSGPDDAPTFTLGAIADAHNGSRSVSSEFSPALSGDYLSCRANPQPTSAITCKMIPALLPLGGSRLLARTSSLC
jgi:hypothetical protein